MKRPFDNASNMNDTQSRIPRSVCDLLTIVDNHESICSPSSLPPPTNLLARLEAFLPKIAKANDELSRHNDAGKPDVVEKLPSAPVTTTTPLLVERRLTRHLDESKDSSFGPRDRKTDGNLLHECAKISTDSNQSPSDVLHPKRQRLTQSKTFRDTTEKSDGGQSNKQACEEGGIIHLPTDVPSERAKVGILNDDFCDESVRDGEHLVEMHLFVDNTFGDLVPSTDVCSENVPLIRELPSKTPEQGHTEHEQSNSCR